MALHNEKGELKYAEPKEVVEMLLLYESIIRDENVLDKMYVSDGPTAQATENAAHVLLTDIGKFNKYLSEKEDTEIFKLIELSTANGRRISGLEKRCRIIIEKANKAQGITIKW